MDSFHRADQDSLNTLLRGVSRSFYLSIRLLPGPLRRPVGLAYLLARATDTIADTASLPPGRRADFLALLARAIDSGGEVREVVAMGTEFAALQDDADERRLILSLEPCLQQLEQTAAPDQEDIRAVLRHITRGQSLDVERFGDPANCKPLTTADELEAYTYLVAGSVGEFWTDLCLRHVPDFATLPPERMRALGRDYGRGLQLVNILRDIGADLAAGRCYLPQHEHEHERARAQAHPELHAPGATPPAPGAQVWLHWHRRAQELLASGVEYACAVNPPRVRAASALPALLGVRTLALLDAAGPAVFHTRVKMRRREVRSAAMRLALTFAARGPLRGQFARLARKPARSGWDNAANDSGTVRPAEGGRIGQ